MKLPFLALLPTLLASPLAGPEPAPADHRIPTRYESAVIGRRVLALSKLADFSTTFPVSHPHAADDADAEFARRPPEVDGLPISMVDYIADCEDEGNPTVLAVKIGTTFRNAAAGSNVSVSLRWIPPYPPSRHILSSSSLWDRAWAAVSGSEADAATAPETVPYSAANLPRMSLMGYLEPIDNPSDGILNCYIAKHHDARYWTPGNAIHSSYWARLVVQQVYFVGGFGDRAYIGWIPAEEWHAVTREEWQAISLPGEKKGWQEWSAADDMAEIDL